MITGAHSILYASDAEAARAFFRDVLGLAHVDAGHGWLIFKSPPAELAVHSTGPADGGRTEMYLMCDDLASTIAELRAKGVEIADEIEEAGWGRVTRVTVPGAGEIGLYEPLHPTAHDLD
ncbi:extradiol dioxygenase [Nocardia cyriacigeorgica]|uniref:Extradiol dioxygenase n=1 Tax=Nocardia cyriacigeorgica TaxID=135487 RepID=A0A5R8P4A5_9NOCA|nr:VOC family protein [Nocardia cyriacigeorgica]TLF92273.1 extradiol dioxygenase [Nocardia cyriacigeorgica]